jgi:hypothetical protein
MTGGGESREGKPPLIAPAAELGDGAPVSCAVVGIGDAGRDELERMERRKCSAPVPAPQVFRTLRQRLARTLGWKPGAGPLISIPPCLSGVGMGGGERLLLHAAWPQPLHQDAAAIASRTRFVSTLDPDHGARSC